MNSLRRVFGFFTVLPFACAGTLEETARASFLLPAVGAALGALEGLAGWGSRQLFGLPVAAATTLAAALLLTGFHHADGLADVGDALMVHGDAARRIEVIKDRSLGTGAAGALILTYLLSWSALIGLLGWRDPGAWMVAALIVVEISARLSLFTVAAFSKPSHEGSGKIFLEELRGWRIITGVLLSIAVLAVLQPVLPVSGMLASGGAALAAGLMLAATGRFRFGGAGGDLLGAAVELGRAAALLGLIAVLINYS